MTDNITQLPGATIALQFIKLKSELDEDWFEDEYPGVIYSSWDWDRAAGGFVDVPGHFETHLNCSDTFFWGSSDSETVTEENWDILVQTVADLKPIYEAHRITDKDIQDEAAALRKAAYEKYTKVDHPDRSDPRWYTNNNPRGTEGRYVVPEDPRPQQARRVSGAAGDLFAARVRKMRPQGAAYKVRYPEELWPLFNAAGPEREVGIGNPREPGK